ncbi:membrane protein [Alphaproteobacteria bacterium]
MDRLWILLKKQFLRMRILIQSSKSVFVRMVRCLSAATVDLVKHDGIEHAGYISFLLMLGIFPFLVFFVALVGLIGKVYLSKHFGEMLVSTVTQLILDSSWSNFINALKPRIIEITSTPPQSFLTLAILSAIWTASSIFEGIRTILNRAYRVSKPPSYLWRRLVSIIEFVAVVFVMLTIVFCLEILPSLFTLLYDVLQTSVEHTWLLQDILKLFHSTQSIRLLITLTSTFFLIAYAYYFLPNIKQKLVSTFPGAAACLIGWWIFSKMFKYYISVFPQINFIYGSIAGVIISLLYFYMCSMIFIYGAELNYHFSVTNTKSS